MVVLFWLDFESFVFGTQGLTRDLCISVLHSTTATASSGFHLWQFQVFKSDAEGLVVVLFLIGPVRDFLFGHTRVSTGDLWISSPALYHCTMVTSGFHLWQFQVFKSGAEGLVVVLFWLDLWEIFFLATPGFEHRDLWISSPALYHCATVTSGFHLWQFQVLNSGAEGLVVVLFLIGPVRDFLFGHTRVWTGDLWISSPALYH